MRGAVRDGRFEFVVRKVQCGVAQVANKFVMKAARGRFCLYTVSIKNIGNKAQAFDVYPQEALSLHGFHIRSDSEASVYASPNSASFLDSIGPGNVMSVVIAFDIPRGATIATLLLHDSLFSPGVAVSVS